MMGQAAFPGLFQFQTRRSQILSFGFLALALVYPLVVHGDYPMHMATFVLYNMILALSLDIVAGFLGEISFGHAGFIAIGAYTTAILMTRVFADVWWGFWVALPIGGIAAALAGVLVGIPALRISGQYFFMVTMGFGEIIRFIMLNWRAVTNGALGITGIPTPSIGSFNFSERWHFYWLFLAVLVLTLIPTVFLRRSYIGRAWIAIREDPVAAEAMGIRLTFYKVAAFTVSAFFAGLGGGLLGIYLNFLHPSSFLATQSILILTMVILGGSGLIYGALFGAALMTGLSEVLRPLGEARMLFIGAMMMLLMILRPQGILGSK